MTLQEAYTYGQQELRKEKIEDAGTDAWYLLESVTGISRAMYFLDKDRLLSEAEGKKYQEYISVRKEHVPLQHITGVQEFMGLEFRVDGRVLIPRQDTEVLVEQVLGRLKQGMRVLDMCTGSGCILISLLKHCTQKEVRGVGVDVSEEALEVAGENAKRLGVTAEFLQSDLFEKVEGKYDVIVSNPPYIPTDVIRGLSEEVRLHDPLLALDGEEDGLSFYRRIVEAAPDYLTEGGKLCFEIGHDQADAVCSLMIQRGFKELAVKKDLAGLDRVVLGVYNV